MWLAEAKLVRTAMWLAEAKLYEVGITYLSFQFAYSLQKLDDKPECKPGPI
jgi:hypothetical protein